jgi:tripartite-type tricarboxylate transporter receptor subunit TctC
MWPCPLQQIGIDPYITFRAGVQAGKLRVLATIHAERLPTLPDLSTVAEILGLEGFEASASRHPRDSLRPSTLG